MTVDVAVIGGGLSGLAAAVDLAGQGIDVALFEQSGKLGGRCFSFTDEKTGDVVDNGQHVLIGAYHHTLQYLETIGTRHYLQKEPRLRVPLHHPIKGLAVFDVPSLPKPFHLTAGMLKFNLLTFRDRQKLLNVGKVLQRQDGKMEKKLSAYSVDRWLRESGQTEEAIKCLWKPIAVSIMNEQPARASAMLFARSLRSAFLGKTSDMSILLSTVGQTELYVESAVKFLLQKNIRIRTSSEVRSVEVHGSKAVGIQMKNGERVNAHSVISAIPHYSLSKLLPEKFRHDHSFANLNNISSSPIVSIHLWYDKEFMGMKYIGLIDKHLQWLFNRRKIMGEQKATSYLSAVISGAHEYIDLPKTQIAKLAVDDIESVFPEARNASLIHSIVVKEKRATFSPTCEAVGLRPSIETPIENFYLAGDWVDTGLPATIEGAVMSGFNAARQIARK
jgi:squalene-associated FAD-dependent desaturase